MSKFVIEKNVPIPLKGNVRRKYPFAQMEVGDSIFVAGDAAKTENISCSANAYGKRNGAKFSARCVEGGVRIWRIA